MMARLSSFTYLQKKLKLIPSWCTAGHTQPKQQIDGTLQSLLSYVCRNKICLVLRSNPKQKLYIPKTEVTSTSRY